jgi:hypothetical protein
MLRNVPKTQDDPTGRLYVIKTFCYLLFDI